MDLVVSRKEKVQLIVERDGPDCFLCKQPFTKKQGITLDHWIPKSAGGTDEVGNLRLAHKKCNTLKSDLIPKDDSTVPIKEREPKPVKKNLALRNHGKVLRKLRKRQEDIKRKSL